MSCLKWNLFRYGFRTKIAFSQTNFSSLKVFPPRIWQQSAPLFFCVVVFFSFFLMNWLKGASLSLFQQLDITGVCPRCHAHLPLPFSRHSTPVPFTGTAVPAGTRVRKNHLRFTRDRMLSHLHFVTMWVTEDHRVKTYY